MDIWAADDRTSLMAILAEATCSGLAAAVPDPAASTTDAPAAAGCLQGIHAALESIWEGTDSASRFKNAFLPELSAINAPLSIIGDRMLLAEAARHDSPAIITALIELGAELNTVDSSGCTALHHAAWKGSLRAVAVLLAAGACVDIPNSHNETAEESAVANRHGNVAELIKAHTLVPIGPVVRPPGDGRREIVGNPVVNEEYLRHARRVLEESGGSEPVPPLPPSARSYLAADDGGRHRPGKRAADGFGGDGKRTRLGEGGGSSSAVRDPIDGSWIARE